MDGFSVTWDTPKDYSIISSRKIINPKFRTGSVADFNVKKFQGFIGYLYLENNGLIKSADYASIVLKNNKQTFSSIVGRSGEFYFENLAQGRYKGQAQLEGELCQFDLSIPASKEMMVELGEFVCER